MGRCVARSLRPSLRQKFHRRFLTENSTTIKLLSNFPKPPDGEFDRFAHRLRRIVFNLDKLSHNVRPVSKPIEFSLKFFCGRRRFGTNLFRKRAQNNFLYGAVLWGVFNCDFAPVFSLMSRTRKRGITTY